jgi:thiamine pyrophosphate-dependent acetolactate synthase large subunit-like protein
MPAFAGMTATDSKRREHMSKALEGVRILDFTHVQSGPTCTQLLAWFGGVGINATSPDELKRAVNAAMDSGKPTLINAVIDPAAGSESGRIGNLNPQSVLKKK